jgi:cysteinyl-tRNA synthetase
MRQLMNEGYVNILKTGKYTYYVARMTFLQKRYSKSFPYTEEGLIQAHEFLKNLKSNVILKEFNSQAH